MEIKELEITNNFRINEQSMNLQTYFANICFPFGYSFFFSLINRIANGGQKTDITNPNYKP